MTYRPSLTRFRPFFAALASLSATGCAHYYLPAGSLDSPETIGPERVAQLEVLTLQSGTDLVNAATPRAADPETGKEPDPALDLAPINYALGAWLRVRPDLDVGVRIQPYAPLIARVKYQLYGAPESQARAGNWSAAGLASAGLLVGSAPAATSADSVVFYSARAGLIGGRRFGARHLASLSPFFSLAGISGPASITGSGTRFGAGLGYQYDIESVVARLELTWASGSFSQNAAPADAGGWFPGATLAFKL